MQLRQDKVGAHPFCFVELVQQPSDQRNLGLTNSYSPQPALRQTHLRQLHHTDMHSVDVSDAGTAVSDAPVVTQSTHPPARSLREQTAT